MYYTIRYVFCELLCLCQYCFQLVEGLLPAGTSAVTFALVKAYEWSVEIGHGFTLQSNTFWSFYYTAAGIHALHVIAGAIIMLIVAQDAKKNLELHRVELIGIYWHFVDIVWIFLFPLLYIAK